MKNYKNAVFALCLLFFPFIGYAQQPGVQFVNGLSWPEIQAQAKLENKYIFLDCYATWCGPCKAMDKDVYTNDSVGNFINRNFIPVKVQMDTSKTDDQRTKDWYEADRKLEKQYGVNAYPTFLVFSPNGQAVHKGVGFKNVPDFMAFCKDALNDKRQYFTLLAKYERGEKDFSSMAYLAELTYSLDERKKAFQIANDFMSNYLGHLPDSSFYTRENIGFLREFTQSSTDLGFKIMYLHPDRVNKIMQDPMYSRPFVDYIISKEEIDPGLLSDQKNSVSPNWPGMEASIANKYGKSYAERTIASAKMRWYSTTRNWREMTKYTVAYVKLGEPNISNFDLNAFAWDRIYQYSSNKSELNAAIEWMGQVIKTEKDSTNLLPAFMDTYACLLYKSGQRAKALKVEKAALAIAIAYKIENFKTDFSVRIHKMESGEMNVVK